LTFVRLRVLSTIALALLAAGGLTAFRSPTARPGAAVTKDAGVAVTVPSGAKLTLVETAGKPVPARPGGRFDVPFTLVLTNVGATRLTKLTLSDDLRGQLGEGFLAVKTPPSVDRAGTTATTPPGVSTAFDGTAEHAALLDGGSGVLDAGQKATVTVTVTLWNGTPQPLGISATGGGTSPGGAPASGDASAVVQLPQRSGLKLTKTVGIVAPAGQAGLYNVPELLVISNTGNVRLTDLMLTDDARGQLGGQFWSVAGPPAVTEAGTNATAAPAPNPAFDGTSASAGLLSGRSGVLDPGQQVTVAITFVLSQSQTPAVSVATIRAAPPPNARLSLATAQAHVVVPNAHVTLQKSALAPTPSAANSGWSNVTFVLVLVNDGNIGLGQITLTDDLKGELGSSFAGVAAAPVVDAAGTTASSAPAVNGGYDGTSANAGLLDGASGTLYPGQKVTVRVTAVVANDGSRRTNVAQGGGAVEGGGTVTAQAQAALTMPGLPGLPLTGGGGTARR
jgi:hypothetical protein